MSLSGFGILGDGPLVDSSLQIQIDKSAVGIDNDGLRAFRRHVTCRDHERRLGQKCGERHAGCEADSSSTQDSRRERAKAPSRS